MQFRRPSRPEEYFIPEYKLILYCIMCIHISHDIYLRVYTLMGI